MIVIIWCSRVTIDTGAAATWHATPVSIRRTFRIAKVDVSLFTLFPCITPVLTGHADLLHTLSSVLIFGGMAKGLFGGLKGIDAFGKVRTNCKALI